MYIAVRREDCDKEELLTSVDPVKKNLEKKKGDTFFKVSNIMDLYDNVCV